MSPLDEHFHSLVRDALAEAFDQKLPVLARLVAQELEHKPSEAVEYITPNEAAQIARVAPKTIRRWVRDGQLPGCKAGQNRVRVRRLDLESFLAERSPESLSDAQVEEIANEILER